MINRDVNRRLRNLRYMRNQAITNDPKKEIEYLKMYIKTLERMLREK